MPRGLSSSCTTAFFKAIPSSWSLLQERQHNRCVMWLTGSEVHCMINGLKATMYMPTALCNWLRELSSVVSIIVKR